MPVGKVARCATCIGSGSPRRPSQTRPLLEEIACIGTCTSSESVTVAGERFREQERSIPAQQTLGSGDIQNLRNLLTNDPMRAIHVLPGRSTGDEFRRETVPFQAVTCLLLPSRVRLFPCLTVDASPARR